MTWFRQFVTCLHYIDNESLTLYLPAVSACRFESNLLHCKLILLISHCQYFAVIFKTFIKSQLQKNTVVEILHVCSLKLL